MSIILIIASKFYLIYINNNNFTKKGMSLNNKQKCIFPPKQNNTIKV